jgi:predicted phage terminase large subunit-like protein
MAAQSERRLAMITDDIQLLARDDFACYAVALWRGLKLAAFHRSIIDTLEDIERGRIRRCMFFVPPRHSKSLFATQLFAAWYLGRHPDHSIISVSYGQELANGFGRRVRNLVSDPVHQAIFPECRISGDAASANCFETTRRGSYFAVGRGGPITGRGANLLIIDDPLKDRQEAESELVRRNLYEWYTAVAYTRLQPDGAVALIQTRWHEDDLGGRLQREHGNENWVVVCRPAIAETDEEFRRAGEALWPEQFPLAELEKICDATGSANFCSLYQQRPSAAEGSVFKREWWRYFDVQPACRRVVCSWDTAYKTGAENDYSVATIWGVHDTGYYLLWFWRGRVEFPELKKQMCLLAQQWNPNQILVEDAASGQSLIQELRYQTALPIIPVKVDRDKLARAQAITPLIEAGKVFLPRGTPWLPDYVEEMAAFPTGIHDDVVDSTTQALNYLLRQTAHSVSFSTVRL